MKTVGCTFGLVSFFAPAFSAASCTGFWSASERLWTLRAPRRRREEVRAGARARSVRSMVFAMWGICGWWFCEVVRWELGIAGGFGGWIGAWEEGEVRRSLISVGRHDLDVTARRVGASLRYGRCFGLVWGLICGGRGGWILLLLWLGDPLGCLSRVRLRGGVSSFVFHG